jgi:hypothetical protein
LATFAGSDAYRWLQKRAAAFTGTERRWHRSTLLCIVVGLSLLLILSSLAFVFVAMRLRLP